MKPLLLPLLVAGTWFAAAAGVSLPSDARSGPAAGYQDPQDPVPPSAADIQKMMAKARQFTQPGKNHEVLKRFLGKWRCNTRLVMGGRAGEPEAGTAEFRWLMPGRWLRGEMDGKLMGQPLRSFSLLGYDNMKQSFVATTVSSMDTAMLRSEGDLTHDGKALITYGTLDEYLSGEHDKMVKYVWRFVGDDKIVAEVHDLPIGEEHTKVIEVTYERVE